MVGRIGNRVEGIICGFISGTSPASAWQEWRNPRSHEVEYLESHARIERGIFKVEIRNATAAAKLLEVKTEKKK